MFGRTFLILPLIASVIACGSENSAPDILPSTPPTESNIVEPESPVSPTVDSPAPEVQEPVNLLRSVSADLAVSSVYRNQAAQVERLVDGDLSTAWNSRSGELVGAWIEVRLPEEVSVTSLMLTAGFTREGGQTDLFTGNHRVSRVRVSRDGSELGVFPLDVDSRELQQIPVEGTGGIYRVEVVETVPGSRSNWREICLSELRVMGRGPTIHEGERLPRLAVGELPSPRPASGTADRGEVTRLFEQRVRQFIHAWNTMERDRAELILNTGDERDEEAARLRATRRRTLRQLADFVAPVDEVASDRVRVALAEGRDDDLDIPVAAFAAVVDWLDQDEIRCRWAIAHARIRMGREIGQLRSAINQAEFAPMDCHDDSCFRDNERSSRIATRNERVLRGAAHDLSNGSTRGVARVRELIDSPRAAPILSALDEAETLCGWSEAPAEG